MRATSPFRLASLPSVSCCAAAAALALAGCGDDLPRPGTGGSDDVGTIEIALMSAPADAGCLKVTAASSRTVTRQFNLTPGMNTVFTMERLPVGVASLDAAAFPGACAGLAANAVPTYVLEAPVNVQVKLIGVAQALLHLIRNGRISIGVDFEDPPWVSTSTGPVDIAVIGDTPYGAAQVVDFPNLIAVINAAPGISEVVHVGDIKNGSTRCDTSYFETIFGYFAQFNDPLVYTPGDNEWTDCHRANNGAYDPLERLAVLRAMFFPVPGLALGGGRKLTMSQSFVGGFETYVENQLWFESSVAFATVHVVGSNNNLAPWFGDDTTGTKMDDPARRTAEVAARTAAEHRLVGADVRARAQPQRRGRRRDHAGGHLDRRRGLRLRQHRAAPGRSGARVRQARAGRPGRHARLQDRCSRWWRAIRSTASRRRFPT